MKTAKVLLKDLSITELKSQYDLNARYLLAHKNILARIMAGCIRNYRGMTPEEIFPLIRDDIKVDIVRVEPGMTNSKIKGLQREDYHPGEGRIVFDIRFTASLPENEIILIIINIEIENGHFPSQKLLSRSIYYPVRELSSQGDRDFSLANQEYEKLVGQLAELNDRRHPERREEAIKETLYRTYLKSTKSLEQIVSYMLWKNPDNEYDLWSD